MHSCSVVVDQDMINIMASAEVKGNMFVTFNDLILKTIGRYLGKQLCALTLIKCSKRVPHCSRSTL
ncbi:hypothetical protein Dimus_024664, partial [Dionaea muscipula]